MKPKGSYYLKKEEKFGPMTSRLYDMFASLLPSMGQFYAFVLNDLKTSGRENMLDVGCGTGKILVELARLEKANLYGIDPSETMVGISKRKSVGLGINLAVGSSRFMPFHRKFDLIFTVLSFHHWQGKEESLRYLSRFLNGNGEIRIYEFNRTEMKGLMSLGGSHSISKEELISVSKRANLKITGVIKAKGFIRATLKKG